MPLRLELEDADGVAAPAGACSSSRRRRAAASMSNSGVACRSLIVLHGVRR